MLKRRGNGRFHFISTWNAHGVFVGLCQEMPSRQQKSENKGLILILLRFDDGRSPDIENGRRQFI